MATNDMPHAGESNRVHIMRRIIWLARTHRHFMMTSEDSHGLGGGQVPVLLELKRSGTLSQRALAERVRVTAATISGMLKRMERAGLIAREPDEADARVSRVRLTERGLSGCEEARRSFDDASEAMLQSVTEEECAQLLSLLNKLQKNALRMTSARDCAHLPDPPRDGRAGAELEGREGEGK